MRKQKKKTSGKRSSPATTPATKKKTKAEERADKAAVLASLFVGMQPGLDAAHTFSAVYAMLLDKMRPEALDDYWAALCAGLAPAASEMTANDMGTRH